MSNNNNIWNAPDDYFERNKSKILDRLELEQEKENFPLLYQNRTNNFIVPEAYFDSNKTQMKTELALRSIMTESIFTTPENYFEEQKKEISQKLSFVPLKDNLSLISRLSKYRIHAAAAVIAISLGFYLFNNSHEGSSVIKTDIIAVQSNVDIDDLDEADLLEQLQPSVSDDIDNSIEQLLEEEDLTNYI
jgi:hypothetical protein